MPKLLLKDQLINPEKVRLIATQIKAVYPAFKADEFIRSAINQFAKLELKARIDWIAKCLHKYLPDNYDVAINVLINALPPPCNPNLSDGDFGDFIYCSFNDYVANYGLEEKYLDVSLNAIKEITTRMSAEFAIRFFINAYPKHTLKILNNWQDDEHYHVRRLCCEGTRPRLPWGQNINTTYVDSLPILDKLFSDKTRFVTRSVANHLNDISKNNPKLVISQLTKWRASKKQNHSEMEFIINHSLRTLIKRGNVEALAFLGYKKNVNVKLSDFKINKQVKIGGNLEFSFDLLASQKSPLIIDYIIYFASRDNKKTNQKVFKLKKIILDKADKIEIKKKHAFKIMTTRKLYFGEYQLDIQINGKQYHRESFSLDDL